MKTYNTYTTDQYYLKIVALSKELAYSTSGVLRRDLVARGVLWHNERLQRYELTHEAIRIGLGDVNIKEVYGHKVPYNIYYVEKVRTFLEMDMYLKEY